MPTPAITNAGTRPPVGDRRRGDHGDPAEAGRHQRHAGDEQRAGADAVAEDAGDRAPRRSASPSRAACAARPAAASSPAPPGSTGRAGRSRRTCRSSSAARSRWPPRRRGCGRSAAGPSARGRAAPRRTKATSEDDAGGDGAGDAEARPAVLVAAHEAPDDAEQAGADEAEAGQVERAVGALGLREPPPGDGQQDEADGHVEPEDPLPGQALDDGAADDRADGDGEAGDAAPDAEREAAAGRRHRAGKDRQGERRHDRAADALQGAGRDQPVDARRQRRRRRAEREDRKSHQEHALAPESVAQRGAGQQQDGERQGVGVHRPLEPLQRGAEVVLDHRQRGGHDQVVQRDHEHRHRGDDEGPDGQCLVYSFALISFARIPGGIP